MVINLSYITMNEAVIGLLGVVGLFVFTFTWCYVEERIERRRKRKYEEQLRKYDTWKRKSYSR